ncbi:hypothetical protein A45J_2435 [hot springs metagenome]
MHFKNYRWIIILLATGYWLLSTIVCADVIDRVVAYVDDTAITLSEFKETYLKMKKTAMEITEEDVINSMINRLLLIKEAKKMKLEAHTDDELLKDYIDIKIRSLILIKESAINQFYMEHIKEFKGRDYLSVRDEIEKYLFELETNKQLKKHLEELRANSEVIVQIKDR